MKALVFDYGAGNLFSLVRALEVIGVQAQVEADPLKCAASGELLVLPGVGAFGLAASRLAPARAELSRQLRGGRPCIGICLGMQVLFDASEEGAGEGLSLIEGRVTRLRSSRCPHIGWTRVGEDAVYFAHGYACRPRDERVVRASATFEGDVFPAIVRSANTIGVQFHPEKSSRRGVELLASLVREVTS